MIVAFVRWTVKFTEVADRSDVIGVAGAQERIGITLAMPVADTITGAKLVAQGPAEARVAQALPSQRAAMAILNKLACGKPNTSYLAKTRVAIWATKMLRASTFDR